MCKLKLILSGRCPEMGYNLFHFDCSTFIFLYLSCFKAAEFRNVEIIRIALYLENLDDPVCFNILIWSTLTHFSAHCG